MKIVITGANSFIGKEFIHELEKEKRVENGIDIIEIIRKETDIEDDNQKIIMEMEKYDQLDKYLKKIDVLVALAWDGTRGETRGDSERQQKNVECNTHLIEIAGKLGCKKVILAGSQAEYGRAIDVPITERTESKPVSEYGKAKWKLYTLAEKICEKYGMKLYEPRFFSLYGKGDYEQTLISQAVKKMKNNELCEFTECKQQWNYLHIQDAVRGMIDLIKKDAEPGIYNFASYDTRQLKDYVLEIKNILKSNSEIRFGARPYGKEDIGDIQPSVEKLVSETGWRPSISFDEGIKSMI